MGTARRTLLVLAATAICALALPAVPAFAGGGGCGSAPTAGVGDVVEIAKGCFNPTALQVDPGATVTFVNLDHYPHNVSALGWGHLNDLGEGDSFTTTFDEAGVYPFACQYHAGMTGAIVVGDGPTLAGGKPVLSDTANDTVAADTAAESHTSTTTGWVAGGAIGLAAGIGIGALARTRIAKASSQT
jgi:plastocyanin